MQNAGPVAAGIPDAVPVSLADTGAATSVVTLEATIDASIDQLLGDHATYRKVMDGFRHAVAAHDARAAANFVRFPIGVDIRGHNVVLHDAGAFEKRYDEFMTPAIAKAIADTNYADVMVNAQGVMLGQGEAWISGVCKDDECKRVDVKVVTIQSGPE